MDAARSSAITDSLSAPLRAINTKATADASDNGSPVVMRSIRPMKGTIPWPLTTLVKPMRMAHSPSAVMRNGSPVINLP